MACIRSQIGIAGWLTQKNIPLGRDGGYFVVRGRIGGWQSRARQGRKDDSAAVREAKASSDRDAEVVAHHAVAKRALGEHGEVWWDEVASDLNRHVAKNTSYASW